MTQLTKSICIIRNYTYHQYKGITGKFVLTVHEGQ